MHSLPMGHDHMQFSLGQVCKHAQCVIEAHKHIVRLLVKLGLWRMLGIR